ncbi:homocysteine S-methyltransferase family protein [Sediminicurvatus halobius]|uniref:Homocysteine S-methyltransferase n=1 Tax=Sediminicurvatus halobius TaxID=2182432 RepID=A0A2U2MYV3_9GAMM|nr:homocysteine S-methyltransferase family protein [Spiribacter halobius]PWG61909.1 homocysteine S-methyltransferase [Spiribacter halobius]UEX79215.1 homocysteine S-methyltransferase family protein [Spiribacter halobius]
MTRYRHHLPQLDGSLFLTDAGIETTLIYQDGQALPHFAAFHLLRDDAGTEVLKRYFRRHARIAREAGTGFIFESATWRASLDWGAALGYDRDSLAALNRKAISMLFDLRTELETPRTPCVISGCIGPRGDGYDPGRVMTADQAQDYHAFQARIFAEAGADMITAITTTNVPEAVGITRAAQAEGMPVVISFTVETDGRLPTGDTLADAVAAVDAATGRGPAYYMINCAHPSHFAGVLGDEPWVQRLRGLRCNASRKSHAELDNADELDAGDPEELGADYRELLRRFPQINVLGGCCGTDHRHMERICASCKAAA